RRPRRYGNRSPCGCARALPPPAEALAAMDGITVFGLLSVTAMVAFYAFEKRSPWCVLGFAAACVLASIYGFLQGAWPFGLVEAVLARIAVQRCRGTAG